MAGIYISLISKELKVLHRFSPTFFFFFCFLIRFRYRTEIISTSLILSCTVTQAAGVGRLPSIVLGPGKGAAGRKRMARGQGLVAWPLQPLVSLPWGIQTVTPGNGVFKKRPSTPLPLGTRPSVAGATAAIVVSRSLARSFQGFPDIGKRLRRSDPNLAAAPQGPALSRAVLRGKEETCSSGPFPRSP